MSALRDFARTFNQTSRFKNMDLSTENAEKSILVDGLKEIVIVRQESKQPQNLPVISVLDVLLSVFIVTPLVVFSWRGSWGFMDIHADCFPFYATFIIGITIHVILAVSQDYLHNAIVKSDKHWSLKIVSHFLRRLYTYVFLTITVLHWRDLVKFYAYDRVRPALQQLQEGLETGGVLDLMRRYPKLFEDVMCLNKISLAASMLNELFTVVYSVKNSSQRQLENRTITFWRDFLQDCEGCWGLLDFLLGIQFNANGIAQKEGSLWMVLLCGLCFATLISIKGLRNATAPPFAICIDKGNYVFRFPTMFRRKTKHSLVLTTLDALFSVAVIGNLVVSFWRGLWVITDILLLPNDVIWSSWMSLIFGTIVVGLVYRLQTFFKTLCAKLTGVPKIIAADTYIVLSIVATILYWRGIWNLGIIYILPNEPELNCILSHIISFMFLLIIGCSNSLLVRGVYKDAKEPNGECVVFPCKFLEITLAQENSFEPKENIDINQEKLIVNKENINK